MSDSHAVIARRPIPPELDRWNWGAFLLNWIWGIGNNTYIALLTLIPPVAVVMVFVLGAKGSRWAWQNGRWDSVEHFKRVQRGWAKWGAIIWLGGAVLFASTFFGIFALLTNSEAYQLGVAKLQASPVAVAVLGTPIKADRPYGKISVQAGGTGEASLNFAAHGPKAAGTVVVEAVRKDGVWTITRLTLKPDGSDKEIELIGGAKNNST